MKLNFSGSTIRLFFLLLVTDISFMILHIIYAYTDLTPNKYFSIELDRGYAEIFQYIKTYWIAILLCVLALRLRSILYFIWSGLFFYLLLDDYFQIHENVGLIISNKLAFTSWLNLRGQDFGELAVSAGIGLVFLIGIGTAYYFGDRVSRQISRYLIKMLCALAVCGIIVDMLHVAIGSPSLDPLFALLEDGGELVVMSVIACFIFFVYDRLTQERLGLASNTKNLSTKLLIKK